MRDNNILTRHIKPGARKVGLGFVILAVAANFTRDLAQDGRSRRERPPSEDAALSGEYNPRHLSAIRYRVATADCRETEQLIEDGAVVNWHQMEPERGIGSVQVIDLNG